MRRLAGETRNFPILKCVPASFKAFLPQAWLVRRLCGAHGTDYAVAFTFSVIQLRKQRPLNHSPSLTSLPHTDCERLHLSSDLFILEFH